MVQAWVWTLAGRRPRTESLAPKSRDLTHAGRCVSSRAKALELPTRSDYRPNSGHSSVTLNCDDARRSGPARRADGLARRGTVSEGSHRSVTGVAEIAPGRPGAK